MIYFQSKYLADRLHIKPAKWKRWTREFLKPDPLGGYQSGYARQFSYKEAFRVFLGGYLVGEQKFSIAGARQILSDLDSWLKKRGLYGLPSPSRPANSHAVYIYISHLPSGKYAYAIRTILSRQHDATQSQCSELYRYELIGCPSDVLAEGTIAHARVLMIDTLHSFFLEKIGTV